jgi:hypothetical protein
MCAVFKRYAVEAETASQGFCQKYFRKEIKTEARY